jgi:hypothetical protein
LALAGSASATAPSSNYTLRITGYVPVICNATLDASIVPVNGGQVSLGQLNEFCNSPNGYNVYVDASPTLADASLVIDGTVVDIADEGSTLISSSTHADIASRNVALNLPETADAGTLSVRIVAL